jgi:2-polyprenyl-3-methyl-5-hydroxy-6-metoxy-1,4-benzoquinol methylase
MKQKISESKEVIELINSYGPFNHSVWQSNNLRVTNEEGLSGRANFLAKSIKKIIVKNFTTSNLRKMSIVDVGCYDGWLLHQISSIPFHKMVGIEPREKNIMKGKKIRQILDIKTNVKLRKGSIDTLGNEYFDIVLCIGTLHHVESIFSALRKLDSICKKMLILETICLPAKYITDSLKQDMELKDIIYQYKMKKSGITGQKYESSYYDGSASETTIVSIPSIESLLMYLDVLGYEHIKIVAYPTDFTRVMKENKRPSQEVLLYAVKNSRKKKDESLLENLKNYEEGMIKTIIPIQYILPLYEIYCLQKKRETHPSHSTKRITEYMDWKQKEITELTKYFRNRYETEIIKNLRFNPADKISFEYAKILYVQKQYSESIKVLKTITQKINADWRSVYRSFYLLAQIYKKLDKKKESQRYVKLCKTCHPNFSLVEEI